MGRFLVFVTICMLGQFASTEVVFTDCGECIHRLLIFFTFFLFFFLKKKQQILIKINRHSQKRISIEILFLFRFCIIYQKHINSTTFQFIFFYVGIILIKLVLYSGSEIGTIINVTVSDCDLTSDACKLISLTNASIGLQFELCKCFILTQTPNIYFRTISLFSITIVVEKVKNILRFKKKNHFSI